MNVEVEHRPARSMPWIAGGLVAGLIGAVLLVGGWTFAKGNSAAEAVPTAQAPIRIAQAQPEAATPAAPASLLVRGTLPDFTALVERFGPAVVNISVTGINDPPAGVDNTVTTNEDTDKTFAATDFPFSDTA